ncbi:MAG: hypothetical protein SOS50_03355, partial [Oliverpabstia sp.]|nr:hypothetical protein [Oliverpabstia sp.]
MRITSAPEIYLLKRKRWLTTTIFSPFHVIMIPGSKGLNPHELAQMWVNVLETRQNMSLKVGRKHHDMRIFCRIV